MPQRGHFRHFSSQDAPSEPMHAVPALVRAGCMHGAASAFWRRDQRTASRHGRLDSMLVLGFSGYRCSPLAVTDRVFTPHENATAQHTTASAHASCPSYVALLSSPRSVGPALPHERRPLVPLARRACTQYSSFSSSRPRGRPCACHCAVRALTGGLTPEFASHSCSYDMERTTG